MENKNDADKDLINEITQRPKSRLPIIALAFGFAPAILIVLMQIPILGIIFVYLFFCTWWGIHFQCIGVILGIAALCDRRKYIGTIGVTFSIFSILSPLIWGFVLYYLNKYTSVEIFL